MRQWCALLCPFCASERLTNKRDIRVSTADGRMVGRYDDGLVVNMGEPNFEPSAVPFALTKRKDLDHARRRADNLMRRGVDGKSHRVIQVDDVDTRW
ncbi:hypothetical protein ACNKHL_23305 [Shigella flexneri]